MAKHYGERDANRIKQEIIVILRETPRLREKVVWEHVREILPTLAQSLSFQRFRPYYRQILLSARERGVEMGDLDETVYADALDPSDLPTRYQRASDTLREIRRRYDELRREIEQLDEANRAANVEADEVLRLMQESFDGNRLGNDDIRSLHRP